MMLLCITFGALLLHSASAVHFDGMSVVCALQCDWGLKDFSSCEQRDNFASCVDRCGESLPTKYMKRSHQEYRDIVCKLRNSTVDEAVHEALIRFGGTCTPRDLDEDSVCRILLNCLGSFRKASLGKQGFENDVLKIAEIVNVLMYIELAAADPKLDIPQSCADILSGKDA